MARRNQITVVQIRVADLMEGDVINRRGHISEGWFEVAKNEEMPSGEHLVSDEAERIAFLAKPLDIVWLQIVAPLEGNSHLAF